MRMACQAPTATTGRLVFQLKAERHDKGEDTFEERLAIVQQLKIRRFVLKIDSNRAVFAGLAGCVAHGHPSGIRSRKLKRHDRGNALPSQDYCEGLRGLPLKAMECEKSVTEIYVQFKLRMVCFCTLAQGTPRLLVPMAQSLDLLHA